MVTEVIDIQVRETGARVVRRNIEDIGNDAQKSGSQVDVLSDALKRVGAFLGVREIMRWADAWSVATSSIKIATKSAAEHVQVQNELFKVAQRSRQEFGAMAELYAAVARQSESLKVSQAGLIKYTENIAKSLAIQHTSMEAARGPLLQLGQAMASGNIRAQEFNSIMLGLPYVMKVVAENFKNGGMSVMQLRQEMLKGRLTSKDFFEAFERGSKQIQDDFDKTQVTFSQAFTMLRNEVVKFTGTMDSSLGAAASFASAVKVLANNLTLVAGTLATLGIAKFLTSMTEKLSGFIKTSNEAGAAQKAMAAAEADAAAQSVASANATRASQIAQADAIIVKTRAQQASIATAQAAIVVEREGAVARLVSVNADMQAARAALAASQANGALSMSIAVRNAAEAELFGLQGKQAMAINELAALGRQQTAVNIANAESTAALAAATRALSVAQGQSAAAGLAQFTSQTSVAASVAKTSLASTAAAVAVRGLSGAMAMMGGPIGLAITALVGLVMWLGNVASKASDAKAAIEAMNRAKEAKNGGPGVRTVDAERIQAALNLAQKEKDDAEDALERFEKSQAEKRGRGSRAATEQAEKNEKLYGASFRKDVADATAKVKQFSDAMEDAKNLSVTTGGAAGKQARELAEAKAAFEASTGKLKTATTVQEAYTQAVEKAEEAHKKYREELVKTNVGGANDAAIKEADRRQRENAEQLRKNRDAELKALQNKGAGPKPKQPRIETEVELGVIRDAMADRLAIKQSAYDRERRILEVQHRSGIVSEGEYQAKVLQSTVQFEAEQLSIIEEETTKFKAEYEKRATLIKNTFKGQKMTDELAKLNAEWTKFQSNADVTKAKLADNVFERQAISVAKLNDEVKNLNKENDKYWMRAEEAMKKEEGKVGAKGVGMTLSERDATMLEATTRMTAQHAVQLEKLANAYELARIEAEAFEAGIDWDQVDAETVKTLNAMEDKVKKFGDAVVDAALKMDDLKARAAKTAGQEFDDKEAAKTKGRLSDIIETAIFQGGKAGGEKLRDYLKEMFLKKPLRLVLDGVFNSLGNGVLNVLGGNFNSGGGSNSGSGNSDAIKTLDTILSGNSNGGGGNQMPQTGGAGPLGMISNIYTAGKTAMDLWNGTGPIASAWKGISSWASSLGTTGAATTATTAATTTAVTTSPVYTATAVGTNLPAIGAAQPAIGAGGAAAANPGTFLGMGPAGWIIAIGMLIGNAFGMFRKKSIVGAGLQGTLGGKDPLTPWEEHKEGGTLFSGSRYETKNPIETFKSLRQRDLDNIAAIKAGGGTDGNKVTFSGGIYDSANYGSYVASANSKYAEEMEEMAWRTAGQSEALNKDYTDMRANIVKMANGLGLAGDKVKDFAHTLDQQDLNFMNLDEEEITDKINDAMGKAGTAIAKQLVGTWVTETVEYVQSEQTKYGNQSQDPEYQSEVKTTQVTRYVASEFAKAGETAMQTLTRLYTSFNAVNEAAEMLGMGTFEASLGVAAAADKMVEAFGGLEKFLQTTSSFVQAYFSKQEQNEALAGRGSRALKDLGIDISPQELAKLSQDDVKNFVVSMTGKASDKDLSDLMNIAVMIRPLYEVEEAAKETSQGLVAVDNSFQQLLDTIKNSLEELQRQGLNLTADLLELQGNDASAMMLRVAMATEKWDDNSRKLYVSQMAYNQSLQDQIDLLKLMPSLTRKYVRPDEATHLDYVDVASNLKKSGFNESAGALGIGDLSQFATALEGLSKNQIANAVIQISAMPGVTDSMRLSLAQAADTLADLKDAQIEATKAERDRMIGLRDQAKALSQNIGTKLGESTADRQAELWSIVNGSGDLEKRISAAEELNSLIEATAQKQNEAAQKAYEAAKAQIEFAKTLKDYVDSLKVGSLSALTPSQKMSEAASQYQQLLVKAQGGDVEAQGKIQEAANTYLELAKEFDPSTYGAIFNTVTTQLTALADSILSTQQPILDQNQAVIDAQEKGNGLTAEQTAELVKLKTAVDGMVKTADQNLISLNALLAWQTANIGPSLTSVEDIRKVLVEGGDIWENLPGNIAAALAPLIGAPTSNYNPQTSNFTDKFGSKYDTKMLGQEAMKMVEAGRAQDLYNLAVKHGITSDMLASWTGTNAQALRDWAISQGLPSFAYGGQHMGGARLVGEYGPELEVSGAARYYNSDQMRMLLAGEDDYGSGGGGFGSDECLSVLKSIDARLGQVEQAVYNSGAAVAGATVASGDKVANSMSAALERNARKISIDRKREAA